MKREEQIIKAADEYYLGQHFNDIKIFHFVNGAKWADETTIQKAQEYLRTHLWETKDDDNDSIVESVHNITLNDFIKDFIRYLEE